MEQREVLTTVPTDMDVCGCGDFKDGDGGDARDTLCGGSCGALGHAVDHMDFRECGAFNGDGGGDEHVEPCGLNARYSGSCGASVRTTKRTIDQLGCSDGSTGMVPKRLKRTLADAPNQEDLLQFLEIAFRVEHEKDYSDAHGAVRGRSAGLQHTEYDFDVQAVAREAMAAAKPRIFEQEADSKVDAGEVLVESDEDDLLKLLDVAYEKENDARQVKHDVREISRCARTSTGADHLSACEADMDVRAIGAVAMMTAKYTRALTDKNTAYGWIHDEDDGEIEDFDEHVARSVPKIRESNQRRYQHGFRDRCRSRKKTAHEDNARFGPVTEAVRVAALKRLQKAMGPEGLDECVCVACDELVLRRDARRKEASDWRFMSQMRRCLGEVDETQPQALIYAYAAPACVTFLANVMVAPNSFHCYTDATGHATAWFSICTVCHGAVDRGRMPRFAISNGFWIGTLPAYLAGLTLPERFMTQLVSVSAMTRVMRGGRHRCIRSHCIAFDCTPAPPVSLLPRPLSDVAEFRVAIVGDFTEAQLKKVKKLHQIRASKLRDVYEFYTRNNHLYADVARNDSVLLDDIDYDLLEHLILEHIEDEGGAVDDSVRGNLENIRGHSDVWQVADERDELTVVERRIGLSDASKELLSHGKDQGSEQGQVRRGPRTFLVKRSNQFSSGASGDLLGKIFPHLFPYGRGHPCETRKVPVSLKECVKHYTLLSGRQFAEDELFTLLSFDRISMKNMYTQNSIRCQRFPTIYSGFESVGSPELEKALLENEQRVQGQRSSRSEKDSLAHKFLKTVEIASAAVWGSNAERAKCRQKAFGYQLRYCQPTLFMTLTPNTDNSLVLAHYAGSCSVESLFDILEAKMPTKAELRQTSLGNDCASTRLFMRSVDAFIEHVLGINPATQEQTPFRGLIGSVQAYFGMIETQGRGTLHMHILVWLNGIPTSTVELENMLNGLDGHAFQQRVESYVQSIVSNTLPLPIEQYTCAKCGASYSHLVGLAIPQCARQNPRRGIYNSRLHSAVVEPALVQCGICKTKCSSQHILRNVLLQSRPLHWPPWARDLTSTEIDNAASREVVARDSFAQAVDAVNEREKAQLSIRDKCRALVEIYRFNSTPDTENLETANATQMTTCTSDDDPFQNDELKRLIEALPPMISDGRMDRVWMNYMVSSLVVLLNQHWWSHTSSCFKISKSTVNDSFCRYLFPHDRSPQTKFDLTGVSLERKVAHEFVNGFNYEMMAAFKCNHDIQVLLGGRDAAERIHYCTKYVTKQQKRLDSIVVIALASFQRRQEREMQAECDDNVQSTEGIANARKRVASMAYTMTSRQEVAGPLAALYIYRGSCCYESSRCSFVPVHDIIRQLCASEDYSCSLVDESNESETSRFQAVSFLDDYIYRPKDLESVNIYQFAMLYFRKKDGHALTATLPFKSAHPLHRSHSLGKRYKEVVPVIQGFRLPFVTKTSPKAIRYKRAILSLVLFKSFRKLVDLIGSEDDCEDRWLDSYVEWIDTRCNFVVKIMSHIDDFYSGENQAKSRIEQAELVVGATLKDLRPSDDDSDSDDSLLDCYDFDHDSDTEVSIDEAFVDPWGMNADASTIVDTQTLDPAKCPTSANVDSRIARILEVFKTHKMLEESAFHTVASRHVDEPQPRFPVVEDMRKWVQDSNTDNKLREASPTSVITRDTEVIELLDEALAEDSMSWWNVSCDKSAKRRKSGSKFASISDISRDYTLNIRQHHAFRLIGRALLTRWRKVEDLTYVNGSHNVFHEDQLRLFLGGEGGTGKSRVLDAVEALCVSWNRADCVVKTALTGKAATMISGRTLASFLLQLKRKRRTSSIYLDILVINEISMMKKHQLAQLDRLLRIAKRVPTVPFGGIHVVLVGDFLQLPPVGGEPLYKRPTGRRQQNANELAGYQLWQTFDCIVMLEESVRFHADPEWGRGCKYARKGIWFQNS